MNVVESIRGEYLRYKKLAEAAMQQAPDDQLSRVVSGDSNSIAAICWHVSGNLKSRFTDFLDSDGEKPWRNRDEEFEPATLGRERLLQEWEAAWNVLFVALAAVSEADLGESVTVRGQPLRIDEALHRSLAHAAYHVGQIVYLAKAMRAEAWHNLSIPRGGSQAYNRAPTHETAASHAGTLRAKPK